jgi:Mlc titration factor MtfA (ptsG expression regulator)
MGLFDWFNAKPNVAVDDDLWAATLARFSFLQSLTVNEQKDLKNLVENFLADKEFSAAGGLELTDEICVSIAAQGCLPILKLGLSAYREWVGIIVYPDEFVVPRQIEDENGVIHEFNDVLSGEAWEGGPLIISWHDVQLAGTGYNVVIHEFAHKLDMLNGEADGMPALHSGLSEDEWITVFSTAYEHFCQRVDAGDKTIIDPYASEEPAEFFAVFSEAFFELPATVNREYPAIYDLLKRYYLQDPLQHAPEHTLQTPQPEPGG